MTGWMVGSAGGYREKRGQPEEGVVFNDKGEVIARFRIWPPSSADHARYDTEGTPESHWWRDW